MSHAHQQKGQPRVWMTSARRSSLSPPPPVAPHPPPLARVRRHLFFFFLARPHKQACERSARAVPRGRSTGAWIARRGAGRGRARASLGRWGGVEPKAFSFWCLLVLLLTPRPRKRPFLHSQAHVRLIHTRPPPRQTSTAHTHTHVQRVLSSAHPSLRSRRPKNTRNPRPQRQTRAPCCCASLSLTHARDRRANPHNNRPAHTRWPASGRPCSSRPRWPSRRSGTSRRARRATRKRERERAAPSFVGRFRTRAPCGRPIQACPDAGRALEHTVGLVRRGPRVGLRAQSPRAV